MEIYPRNGKVRTDRIMSENVNIEYLISELEESLYTLEPEREVSGLPFLTPRRIQGIMCCIRYIGEQYNLEQHFPQQINETEEITL